MSAALAGITGPATALAAGLVTSLHCAGMCGPLACALLPAGRGAGEPQVTAAAYHTARLTSYAVFGALAGGLGRWPLMLLGADVLRFLPWLLVLFFAGIAFRLDRQLPRLPLLGRAYGAVLARLRQGSRVRAAAFIGLATPLLPCGPFYLVLSLALFAGSALRGAETLLAFGLGTVPLLWFAQANFGWLRARLGPAWLGRLRLVVALAVALILAWRLRGTLGLGGAGPDSFVCF